MRNAITAERDKNGDHIDHRFLLINAFGYTLYKTFNAKIVSFNQLVEFVLVDLVLVPKRILIDLFRGKIWISLFPHIQSRKFVCRIFTKESVKSCNHRLL